MYLPLHSTPPLIKHSQARYRWLRLQRHALSPHLKLLNQRIDRVLGISHTLPHKACIFQEWGPPSNHYFSIVAQEYIYDQSTARSSNNTYRNIATSPCKHHRALQTSVTEIPQPIALISLQRIGKETNKTMKFITSEADINQDLQAVQQY